MHHHRIDALRVRAALARPVRAPARIEIWIGAGLLVAGAACSPSAESQPNEKAGFWRPDEAAAPADPGPGGAALGAIKGEVGVVHAAERATPTAGPLAESAAAAPGVPQSGANSNEPARPSPEPEPRSEAARASPPPDVEIAAALVHKQGGAFEPWLDRNGAGLSSDRRKLLCAFAAWRDGRAAAADELARGLERSKELSPREQDLVREALAVAGARALEGSLSVDSVLERALALAAQERAADVAAAAADWAAAARGYSRLLLAELDGTWESDRDALARWTDALNRAQRQFRWNPRAKWPGIEVTVQPGDSLIAIRKRVLAQRPELLLCTGLIARANGLTNEDAIRPGDVLRVPTDRARTVVDVSARWVLYVLGEEVAAAWEVGVGKDEGTTRQGSYVIGDKQSEPMWFQPGRAPVPFGDPENPLGTRWLAWNEGDKGTSLGFHGTSDPSGVGGRVSRGCVRMRNEDVEVLYDILPKGAEVEVRP